MLMKKQKRLLKNSLLPIFEMNFGKMKFLRSENEHQCIWKRMCHRILNTQLYVILIKNAVLYSSILTEMM